MTVTISELGGGLYALPLSTAHTDTLGVLTMYFTASGIPQINLQYRVHARINDDLMFPNVSGRGVDVDAAGGVEVGSFQAGAITAAAIADAAIDRATFAADTGLQTVRSGTCQAGSTLTRVKLDASASATDHIYDDLLFKITGGTGVGQSARRLLWYIGSDLSSEVQPPFITAPDATTTYALLDASRTRAPSEFGISCDQIITMAAGERNFHGSRFVNGKLFVSTVQQTPAKLIRFNNPSVDLTDYTVLTFANDGFHNSAPSLTYSDTTRKIYVMFWDGNRTTIAEVDPLTMTSPTDVISNTADVPINAGAIEAMGDSLYLGIFKTTSKVIRYALSGFGITNSVTLATNMDGLHAMRSWEGQIIVTGRTNTTFAGWIAKIDPSMTYTSQFFTSAYQYPTDDFAILNGYAWLGFEYTGNLARVNLRDITDYVYIDAALSAGETPYAVVEALGWIWAFGGTSTTGQYRGVLIHPESGAIQNITYVTGASGGTESTPSELLSDGQHIYATYYQSPAKVARWSLHGATPWAGRHRILPELAIDGATGNVRTAAVTRTGIAQAATSSTITLDSAASATDDYYRHQLVLITSATTGAYQARKINSYVGSTKVATVTNAAQGGWVVTPTGTITYALIADGALSSYEETEIVNKVWDEPINTSVHLVNDSAAQQLKKTWMRSATTQAGTGTSVTLDASASATDDFYKDHMIVVYPGGGSLTEIRRIVSYVGSTKVATVDRAWIGAPGAGTQFAILADSPGPVTAAVIAADTDVYSARITLIDDNTGTTDRYVVNWYRNGQDVTSGITSPTIQVVKASDGTDLIASTAMTQIASTGAYRYDATTTARIVSGAAYFVIVAATIGGSARTYRQGWGRDS